MRVPALVVWLVCAYRIAGQQKLGDLPVFTSPFLDKVPRLSFEILALVLGDVGLVETFGGFCGEWLGDGGGDDTTGGHCQDEEGWKCEAHRERCFGLGNDFWLLEIVIWLWLYLRELCR